MPNVILPRAVAVGIATLLAAVFVMFPEGSLPDQAAHFLSDHVNDGFQILAHLLMFAKGWRLHSWKPVWYHLSVALTVTSIVQLSKYLFKNFSTAEIALRPSGGYDGFPSGHASATFSLAFVLSIYYPRLWWLWYAVAGLVTWSRVQTNAHTLLQITVGFLFGTIVAYWFAIEMERRKK